MSTKFVGDGNGLSCLTKNISFQLCKGVKSLLCLLFHTPVAPTWASGSTVNKQT